MMRRDAAEKLNKITIECTEKRARDIVMVHCEGDELKKYFRTIAEVLAAITMLAGPIYAQYPDLMPPQLRDRGE
jgi:hypothetical protein